MDRRGVQNSSTEDRPQPPRVDTEGSYPEESNRPNRSTGRSLGSVHLYPSPDPEFTGTVLCHTGSHVTLLTWVTRGRVISPRTSDPDSRLPGGHSPDLESSSDPYRTLTVVKML